MRNLPHLHFTKTRQQTTVKPVQTVLYIIWIHHYNTAPSLASIRVRSTSQSSLASSWKSSITVPFSVEYTALITYAKYHHDTVKQHCKCQQLNGALLTSLMYGIALTISGCLVGMAAACFMGGPEFKLWHWGICLSQWMITLMWERSCQSPKQSPCLAVLT